MALMQGCAHDEPGETSLKEDAFALHDRVATAIDDLAERIDLYAANRDAPIKPNNSRITIHNGATITQGGKKAYAPRAGVRLHLPNLQRKLQLSFTNYDETAEDRGINESRYRPETAQERSYGTSLALFQTLGKVRTEFTPRADFRRGGIETSYLFRFTSSLERGSFSIDPELQLFARSDVGTGQFFALNPTFQLAPADQLVVLNEEQYTDGDNTLSTNHGLRWRHSYNARLMQETSAIAESNNRSTYHLSQVVCRSSLRYQFWENVLHLAATPYVSFAKGVGFEPASALDLAVDLIF